MGHEVAGEEEGVATARGSQIAAAIAVACLALLLPALPIAAVAGVVPDGLAPVAAWAAAVLAAGVGGGKLAAVVLGAARSMAEPDHEAAAAPSA